MKIFFRLSVRCLLGFTLAAACALSGQAVTFTNDTTISFNNTAFDGQDVVVNGCTLAVDGSHAFTNLRITPGGTLTHTYAPNGLLVTSLSVTNEPQTLTDTNAVALANSNILTATLRVTDPDATVVFVNDVDYVLSDLGEGLIGLQRTTDSAILDGGMVLVSYEVLESSTGTGLNLTVSGDCEVEAGASINADGRGYGENNGAGNGGETGSPRSGGGGGHGGNGGNSSSNAPGGVAYGTITQPYKLGGSGGWGVTGAGGAGGGLIRLVVRSNLTIQGTVSANGANGVNTRSGGGAGGSIWIMAGTLSGSGAISANGGSGEPVHGGGGGGGRIAVTAATHLFSGQTTAHGGAGFQRGGAGTIYSQLGPPSIAGVVTVDNGGGTGAITPFSITSQPALWVRGGAVVAPTPIQYVGRLLVESNSWLTCLPGAMRIEMTVTSNAVFEAGSGIDLRGKGYAYGQGNGAGLFYSTGTGGVSGSGGGGGHAGYGGMGAATNLSRGGNYYDYVTSPGVPGSGGGGNAAYPGGAGGGLLFLTVSKVLQLDGSILADGERPLANVAGGGSGGSVRLTAGTLAGAGNISANGGSAFLPNGGGGSGGLIAVSFNSNAFTGTMTAYGGTGFQKGAAGTIHTKTNNASIGQLVVDNGGTPGTNTFLTPAGMVDLTLRRGAVGMGLSSFRHLTLGTNTALLLSSGASSQTVTVTGDAVIEAGASLSVDGFGSLYNQGSGGGRYYNYGSASANSGGGGGHGGYGGHGAQGAGQATGGNAYDYANNPIQPGSGGGGTSTYPGGSGGGGLRLNVTGALRLDGRISADGMAPTNGGAGGGSGGSLLLDVGGLSGMGQLSANGGAGHGLRGGGGGGGRIAVTYFSNAFAGTVMARGGPGFLGGGAGTIYFKAKQSSSIQLTMDNGGLRGTNTLPNMNTSGSVDWVVRGGAISSGPPSQYGLQSLFVGSNSWVYASGSWSIAGDAMIEAGGGILADGAGYPPNQGVSGGAGRYWSSGSSGGGGGHGGFGGFGLAGATSAAGGTAYNPNLTRPNSMGSGGGNYYSYSSSESAGGGAFGITMTRGRLQLDGTISANGLYATTNGGGGGAGGSVLIDVYTLAGSGVIAANGGDGHLPNGGGGGGGHVAVYWTSNAFTGTTSARGGDGFTAGGAGTVYLKASREIYGRLIVDNAGQRGTNTLVAPVSPLCELTLKGGAVAVLPSTLSVLRLNVQSNSAVVLSNQTVTVSGDASIQVGGAILADGTGYGPASGPGAGINYQTPKAGANHAGLGGFNPNQTGYGNLVAPATWGSGGGNGSGSSGVAPYGGAGGGAAILNVTGRLLVDGRVSANGRDGALNSGGGAGGSVWLTAGTLAGAGTIVADGGAGNGPAGGGGGGCVAIHFKTNTFAGRARATGGSGATPGGAGTVFWQQTGSTNKWLVVDNGGLENANLTPLTGLPSGLALRVANGAVAYPQSTFPLFTSVAIGDGGFLTSLTSQTRLELATLGDLTVERGGFLSVDGRGYARGSGNGAGEWLSGQGGGGGHGGVGGAAASGAAGGLSYGSESQPSDRGSGGGASMTGGSEGGGAIRLSVGGTLIVGGVLSANGNSGWQDNAGGGAGGSLWVRAGELTGDGVISAEGGAGELFNGGGGGGGRIAFYSPANTFTGLVSVVGGLGANNGQAGTVFVSTNLPGFDILTHSPSGVVSNIVSVADLTFSDIVNPNSVSVEDFALFTPAGAMSPTNLAVSTVGLFTVRVSFPVQNTPGDYHLEAGPEIAGLFAQPLSQVYTGAFTVALPTLSGTITNAAGAGVPDVLLQPDGGLPATMTEASGGYSIGVPPGWVGSVTPVLATNMFVPGTRIYTNVVESLTNEDYLMVETIAPQVDSGASGTNAWLQWQGIPGIAYQIMASTNLVDWMLWGEVLMGTNGPMQIPMPDTDDPAAFFRVRAAN